MRWPPPTTDPDYPRPTPYTLFPTPYHLLALPPRPHDTPTPRPSGGMADAADSKACLRIRSSTAIAAHSVKTEPISRSWLVGSAPFPGWLGVRWAQKCHNRGRGTSIASRHDT